MNKRTYPKICIASFVQYAYNIWYLCRIDREELVKAGLQWESAEKLYLLLQKFSNAEARYQIAKQDISLSWKTHQKYIKECCKLRSLLSENIRLSLRTLRIKCKFPALNKNWKPEDLVQNLNDLVCLCNLNKNVLEKVNFDFNLSNKAAEKVLELANAIASLRIAKENISLNELAARNQTYIELHQLTKEICLFGRKAFINSPEKKKKYRSAR